MTYKLPENVYQTSNGGGVGTLNLVAPPAGRASFADWLANGDKTIATIKDLNETETSRVTFNTGPDRITRDTLIRSTTGAFVNFSGGGVLDITIGMPGSWVEKLTDPALPNGMLARVDENGNLVGRTLGAGTWVAWTDPDGVSGTPTLVDTGISANFPRKTGAVAETITGSWTFDEAIKMVKDRLILDSLVNGAPKELIMRGSAADDSDMAVRIQQVGIDSYILHNRIGGAWKRVLTEVDLHTPPPVALGAMFEKTGIVIGNTQADYAHGLGGQPRLIQALIHCTSAINGYDIDDEIPTVTVTGNLLTTWSNATRVGYGNIGGIYYNKKASAAFAFASSANFDITLRAYL